MDVWVDAIFLLLSFVVDLFERMLVVHLVLFVVVSLSDGSVVDLIFVGDWSHHFSEEGLLYVCHSIHNCYLIILNEYTTQTVSHKAILITFLSSNRKTEYLLSSLDYSPSIDANLCITKRK